MGQLADTLLTDAIRPKVIDDCVRLIDVEVSNKSGLSGMAVKGAYAVVKKIKPGIIREAVSRLLPEFVEALEPFRDEFGEAAGPGFESFLAERKPKVADALLGVTDTRIGRADNRTIKKAYQKLRPTGQKHVETAVPGVGRVIGAYL